MCMEDKTHSDGLFYEGAVGAYLFVCSATGSTDIRLYASHKQFPVALSQFLIKVQAEHWKCRVVLMDTHSVHISAAVDEVLALFQMQLPPISAFGPEVGDMAERIPIVDIEDIQSDPEVGNND